MSLRRRLTAYVVGLHLVFFAFTVAFFRDEPVLLVTLEALLLVSLAGGVHLIGRALEPFAYSRQFHDLLQDQNYAARLIGKKSSASGELGELINLFNTMLETLYRERMELGEQRGFLDRLLEATPSAVLVFDFDGGVSLMNASAQTLLGLEDAKGKPLSHWLNGEGKFAAPAGSAARASSLGLLAQLDGFIAGESRLLSDTEGRRFRAHCGQFFDRGFTRKFLLVEELTQELESSERATYDKLVRVLAHEVNNTVAATGSVLDSLLFYSDQLQPQDKVDFTTAVVAVKRRNVSLGEFIERFTRVVKMPDPELRSTSLGAMMDDIMWMHREQCRNLGIQLEWAQREELPPQMLDAHLMEQALLNILKNAVEAVQSRQQESASGYVRVSLAHDGEAVRLSVVDSGNLLGAGTAAELFTPFYSTKKGGQGIGLMFVREVLNRHGCTYRLAPNGQGETSFDIWFR